MKRGDSLYFLSVILAVSALPVAQAAIQRTPEQDTLWLSSRLKPIPDAEWQTIAGGRISEKYEIARGDTLYDISKRLFGDPRYWPKIWALNNGSITNPHLIRPGNAIAFLPGTGSSLPSLALQSASGGAPQETLVASNDEATGNGPKPSASVPAGQLSRSEEWKLLPRQSWEFVVDSPVNSKQVDQYGIDQRSKIVFKAPSGFDLPAIAASETLDSMGTIEGSRSEAEHLSLGDTVFIRAEDDLQVGSSYAITTDPTKLKGKKRIGYSYSIFGRVKIIGVKDQVFIGVIEAASGFIRRKFFLIPVPQKIHELRAVAGPTPIDGIVVFDKAFSTWNAAQGKHVYIDRGSDDGVTQGMIFRVYRKEDPVTHKKITNADHIADADVIVLQVSERFSAGLILHGVSTIPENAHVVLMTDVSDLNKSHDVRMKEFEGEGSSTLNDLDNLDVSGGLGPDDEKQLRQLERWKENGKKLKNHGSGKEEDDAQAKDNLDSQKESQPEDKVEPEKAVAPEPAAESLPPTPAESTPPVEPQPGAEGAATPPPAAEGTAPTAAVPESEPGVPLETAAPSPPAPANNAGSGTDTQDLDKLLNE